MQKSSSVLEKKKTFKKTIGKDSAHSQDILKIILEDHKPLKECIEVLKDEDAKVSEKKNAFSEFVPLLLTHAEAEEKTLYAVMKKEDFRMESFEGETEHAIAERLIQEVKAAKDKDQWCAKAKVLAELVEHHIEEEEEELFPDFRKDSSLEERKEIGESYLQLKTRREH